MLNETSENDYNKLNDIALEFAVTANSYINISKRILYLSRAFERIEEQKEKAKKHEEKQECEQKD